jgi:WD40 repeat protein
VLAHRYGVGERLARFVARHRAVVAAALIGAVALLALGAVALRRVVSERNVARSERARALTAQQAAEARQHELVKVQARTSLSRDPTATVAWLKTYQATSADEAREQAALLDEAQAAGVSRHVWRQTDWVQDAVFSPDGASIASASADGLVRIYDVTSGAERVLGQVAGVVQVVSWAPDGASVVCGTAGGELLRWVVRPGASAIPVAPGDDQLSAASSIGPGLSAPIARLTWTGDGAELLVELDRTPPVRLRVADGARAKPWPLGMPDDAAAEVVHGGGATAGTWRLVWGGRDGKVVTLVGDGAPTTVLHRPGRIISALAIDEAGQRLAVHDGAQVWIIPLAGGAPVAIGAYSQPAAWLTFSPGGERLAIGGDDHAITVWTLGGGTPAGAVPARAYRGHTDAVYGVSFARDGARMVSASDDGTARVWDLVTGDVQVLRGHADDVFRARLSPDETRVVTASIDGSVRLWPLAGGARAVLGPEAAGIMRAVLIDDDRLAVAGPGFAARWQLDAGTRTPLFADLERNDRLALVAPAGDAAVTINDDLSLQLWPERGPARTLPWPAELPVDGAFVDGGKAIMLLTRTGAVWSFDLAAGTSAELLPASATASRAGASAADDQVVAAAFSDDGAAVFARGETMYRWDRARGLRTVATGTRGCVREVKFADRGDQVLAWSCTKQFWLHRDGAAPLPLDAPLGDKPVFVTWSPDGEQVAAALANRTALVWDTRTGALRRTLRGHTDLIMSAAFSTSGERVVTGSYDRTMRVWDLGSGDVHVLRGHSASVDFVAWRRAGQEIVSAGRDGTIRVWAAPRDAAGPAALAAALDEATTATLGADDVLATPAVDAAAPSQRGTR